MNRFDFNMGTKIDNPLMVSALLALLIFIVYLYQGIVPAFNADDIIQLQYPEDTYNFLLQGRWGYFLIFGKLFQSNPAPVFATLLASLMLVMIGIYACRLLNFSRYASVTVFIAVSSISVYYGRLFSFDSTRIAYPLANLLAVYGFYLTVTGKWGRGILLMSLAPAFYPAASELAATLFIAFLTVNLIDTDKSISIRQGLLLGMSIFASLILYMIITHLISRFFGFPLGSRGQIDFLAGLHRAPEILALLTKNSFPILARFGPKLPTYPQVFPFIVNLTIFALFVIFLTLSIRRLIHAGRTRHVFLLLLLQIGLVVMPFVLIFASKDTGFPPRSLYSFALIHGFYAGFVLEKLLDENDKTPVDFIKIFTIRGIIILIGILLFFNAGKINMRTFNEYMGSRSELLMANRILMRIENTIADNPLFIGADKLELVIINNKATLVGPVGEVGSVMHVPWARERILHILDRRIAVADEVKRKRARNAAVTHGEWPASDSVFILNDFIVVVVHK